MPRNAQKTARLRLARREVETRKHVATLPDGRKVILVKKPAKLGGMHKGKMQDKNGEPSVTSSYKRPILPSQTLWLPEGKGHRKKWVCHAPGGRKV